MPRSWAAVQLACSFESEVEVCGQPKASKGGCLLVGLVPPEAGKFPAVGGILYNGEEGGAQEEKKGGSLSWLPWGLTQSFPLIPFWASHTCGTTTLSCSPCLYFLHSLVLGRSRPGQPSKAFPASLHPAGPVTGSRPGRSQGARTRTGRERHQDLLPRQAPVLPTRGNRTLSPGSGF